MIGSLRLGSILGIGIRVHVVLAALGLLLFLEQGAAGALGFAILFATVLLHEVGHAIVARRLGLTVADITLGPLGGMARLREMPETSRIEALIASAGPVVNLGLAGLVWAVMLALGQRPITPLAQQALAEALEFNLALGLFNLVPAFPTDGGRLLRAWLARRRSWLEATEVAVRVGAWLAFACAVAGLCLVFSSSAFATLGFALVLVAIFVWWTGKQELIQVRLRHGIAPLDLVAQLLRSAMGAGEESGAPREPPRETGPELGANQIDELERYRGRLESWRREQQGP